MKGTGGATVLAVAVALASLPPSAQAEEGRSARAEEGRSAEAEEPQRAVRSEELTDLPQEVWDGWIALMHYRPDGAGEWQSEVPTRSFFLHEDGDIDPEREWTAARRAFLGPAAPHVAQPAQCRFPARFAFMKAHLGWSEREAQAVPCPDFEAFEQKLGIRSLSIVFASHFIANPASAFGHTMLHVGRSGVLQPELADSSIGFEADTKGLSAAGYIPKGLRGELVAGFRISPFYDRVRKYERQEQRDLWMFPLKLSQVDLDQLVRHLWELQPVSYRYGFFGENCAQKILALIHAVVPRYHLLPFESSATLPSDAVRRIVSAIGLAGQPILRPSLLGRYERRRAALSKAERVLLDRMIAERSVPSGVVQPAVLTAAALWSELHLPYRTFRRASDVGEAKVHRDLEWKRQLLMARATGSGATASDQDESGQPSGAQAWFRTSEPSLLDAHAPSRFTIRGGVRSGDAALGAGMRWLLHEPLDPPAAAPQLSSLEALRVELSFTSKGEFFLEEATALRIEKLAPSSDLQSRLAWRIEIGARRLPGKGGARVHAGAEASLGAGLSRIRPDNSLAIFALLGVRPGALLGGGGDDGFATFAPATVATAGLLLRLPAGVRARLQTEYALSFPSLSSADHGLIATVTVRKSLARDLDLELLTTWDQHASDLGLGAAVGLVMFH